MSDTTTQSTEEPAGSTPAEPSEPTADDYAAVEAEIRDGTGEPASDESASDEADSQDEPADIAKARQQAAKYRARLREAETERDQLVDQLAAQRRAVIDWRAASTHGGVDPALLDAANISVDDLLDDAGHLDMTAVDEFIDATAKRFKVARGFTANRAQGQSGGSAAPKSLADVFRRR